MTKQSRAPKIDQVADRRLLDATLAYVATHKNAKLDSFRDAVTNWGVKWRGVEPAHLPASDRLAEALSLAPHGTPEQELMDLFVSDRATRHWEQTYTTADTAVGTDLLAGYGFAEIIGKRGPFISERVRAGVGLYAAGVDYPAHRHQAEEVYVILAGSGTFRIGNQAPAVHGAPDVIHIPPQRIHGFTMDKEPLVVFYLWQGGDLREKSTFV